MAQFIERFAVAGGAADVSKAFIESMEGMGVEILEVTDIRLDGSLTIENPEDAKSRSAKRRTATDGAAGDDGQPGSQSMIRFQIDIMALSDEKTRIMVRLILSGINIGQLSGKLDKIGQGLIGLITAKFPTIEITLNPIQLPDPKPKTLPRAVLLWGGGSMMALLLLVISLAWFGEGYRNFEKSNFARDESLRSWDTKQQNMVFDTKNSSASGERVAPPEDRFIKVFALPNQVGKNCVVSLTVSNNSPLSISHLEFSIRMYDRDGRDLGSNIIDIESPDNQTIIKNTKIMKFEKVFCTRIARAVIHEIDECIVDGSSSIACHRYLKPDPRSIIPFAR